MISSGRFKFKAEAKRESLADNLGKKQKNYGTSLGFFRCDMKDLSSQEISYGLGPTQNNSWEVQCRWEAINSIGLKVKDVLIVDGKTLRISGIRNDYNRDRLATITTEEIL